MVETKARLPRELVERWPEPLVTTGARSERPVVLLVHEAFSVASLAMRPLEPLAAGSGWGVLVLLEPPTGASCDLEEGSCGPSLGACGGSAGEARPVPGGPRWQTLFGAGQARSPLLEEQVVRRLVRAGATDVRRLSDDEAQRFVRGERLGAPRVVLGRATGHVARLEMLRESGDGPTYAAAGIDLALQAVDPRAGAGGDVLASGEASGADRRVEPGGCYVPGLCCCCGGCQTCCGDCCSGCCGGCCTGCCGGCCWY